MNLENGNQKGQLVAALRQLAQSNNRSKRARLSEIFNDVEAALAAGTTQKQVIATLEKTGLAFTLRSFETTYARIRKERKERNTENESTTATASTTPDSLEDEIGKEKPKDKKTASIATAEKYTSRSDGSFFDGILRKGKTK